MARVEHEFYFSHTGAKYKVHIYTRIYFFRVNASQNSYLALIIRGQMDAICLCICRYHRVIVDFHYRERGEDIRIATNKTRRLSR